MTEDDQFVLEDELQDSELSEGGQKSRRRSRAPTTTDQLSACAQNDDFLITGNQTWQEERLESAKNAARCNLTEESNFRGAAAARSKSPLVEQTQQNEKDDLEGRDTSIVMQKRFLSKNVKEGENPWKKEGKLDPMRLGPKLTPEEIIPAGQSEWVARMRQVIDVIGVDNFPFEWLIDPEANSSLLLRENISKRTP